jgi:hypothetical protein
MFGGNCAYCGDSLGERWHADHIEPVQREWWNKYANKPIGMSCPERDTLANLFPACVPCNIHKHCMILEDWRNYLERQVDMARRNSAPFRHAERFKLISAAPPETKIVFYFEKASMTPSSTK